MDMDILVRVCRADSLPAQPTVALEVLRLTRADDACVDDLIRVIQSDASLTARILRIVNSSLYAIATKVSSIKQAVVALGLRSVQVVAISLSLVDAVKKTDAGQGIFDYPKYWRRTLSTAVAAKLLAARLAPQSADDVFVAGLLADIGMAAAWHSAREAYEPVLQASNAASTPLIEIETELLGVTHAEMSAALLRSWGLPDTLCQAVGAHHGHELDALDPDVEAIARMVRAGDLLAGVFCKEVPPEAMIAIREQIVCELAITPLDLEFVLEEIVPTVNETAAVFSVRLGASLNYEEISADAVLRLAELNAASVLERDESLKREQQAHEEVDRLQQVNSVIRAAARTDGLTAVANRAAFDHRLAKEMQLARRKGQPLGLIMLDIDHFKLFNDNYGHQAGDQVLRDLAACLKEVTARIGYVARYGGEEFAVILAQQAAGRVEVLAEEIRTAIESISVRYGDQELHATVSVGGACLNPQEDDVNEATLVETADKCLYEAKRTGRNRVVTAHERRIHERESMLSRVMRKIMRGSDSSQN